MNKIALIALMSLVLLAGCQNLSPRQDQDIDNQNGKIGEIETLANSLKNEMGNLQSQAEISDSKLEKLQQGLANFQSNYENSGVQILSGEGGLMLALACFTVLTIVAMYYRSAAKREAKAADILAKNIVDRNDPDLEDKVFRAAMYTDVEERVLNVMTKHQCNRPQ